ncbi:hypothetical protein L1987_15941 [Smallanthus sonchifolius]|uniref:Uncharacterized protein n=1 Tax=Smallanthus sonchifolius TaxID=185202 RepID=A0ACB9J6Z8_9ASTR|nr:hypothetical protein L1987_15941 [Smallanthus sonchifolius]
MKKTKLHEDEEGVPPTTLREISILRMLSRDPHVVKVCVMKRLDPKLMLGFYVYVCSKFSDSVGVFVTLMVLNLPTLQGIHCSACFEKSKDSLCFWDLKPPNPLMDRKTMMLKIGDLGLARAFTIPIKKYTHEVSKDSLCFCYVFFE